MLVDLDWLIIHYTYINDSTIIVNILKSINDFKFTQFKLVNWFNSQKNKLKSFNIKLDDVKTKMASYDI